MRCLRKNPYQKKGQPQDENHAAPGFLPGSGMLLPVLELYKAGYAYIIPFWPPLDKGDAAKIRRRLASWKKFI